MKYFANHTNKLNKYKIILAYIELSRQENFVQIIKCSNYQNWSYGIKLHWIRLCETQISIFS